MKTYREILSMSWPILLEMGAQTLIMNLNVLMISQLGDQTVAAVSSANSILGVLTTILGIVGFGSGILVAQYHGAKQPGNTTRVIMESIRVNVLLALGLSLLVFLLPSVWMHIMNVPKDIWNTTQTYLRMMGLLLVFQAFVMGVSGILRSLGKTRVVFYLSAASLGCTFVLNAIFILGLLGVPKMGLNGLILSNALVNVGSALVILWVLMRCLPTRLPILSLLKEWRFTKQIVSVGIPSAAELGSYQITQFVMAAFIALLGTFAISTRQYAMVVESMSFLLGFGVAQGVSILVGHRVGAGEYNRARQISVTGVVMGVSIMTVMAVLLFAFGTPVMHLFTKDPAVAALGGAVLKIVAVAQPAKGLNMVVGGALRGAGDNKWLMWNSGLFVWLSVLFAYFFGFGIHMGLYGIWWGMVLDEWVRAVLVLRRLLGNKWQGKRYVGTYDNHPETVPG